MKKTIFAFTILVCALFGNFMAEAQYTATYPYSYPGALSNGLQNLGGTSYPNFNPGYLMFSGPNGPYAPGQRLGYPPAGPNPAGYGQGYNYLFGMDPYNFYF